MTQCSRSYDLEPVINKLLDEGDDILSCKGAIAAGIYLLRSADAYRTGFHMSPDEALGKWIDGGDVYKVQGSSGSDPLER